MSERETKCEEVAAAQEPRAAVVFDPSALSARSLTLILIRAQEWGCSPSVAMSRLLDELAMKRRANRLRERGVHEAPAEG
jgi:hypothetical protein